MAISPLQDMAQFILEKFRYPNADISFLGASSDHVHLMRDVMTTLNSLHGAQSPTSKKKLFEQLKGQVLALEAIQYYSSQEAEEILIKIELAEK